jgi:micrococcal nuclease
MFSRYRVYLGAFLSLLLSLSILQAQQFVTVKRVIDGDTIVLGTGERVRLIGVDTPETKHPNKPVAFFGKEASAFTKRMAEGKRVKLEYDQANTYLGHKDRYGRMLAFVFLEDGTLLNAEIIRQGFGHALTRYPFSRMEEFRRLESEARDARRGLWAINP